MQQAVVSEIRRLKIGAGGGRCGGQGENRDVTLTVGG